MARAAQKYTVNLAAGETKDLLVEGSFYKIVSASGIVAIARDGGTRLSGLKQGQGEREVEFKKLTVKDESGSANTVVVIVADNTFVDDNLSLAGSIQVDDTGAVLTKTGIVFSGGVYLSAGGTSLVQLWNPVGNTKNLEIDQLVIATQSSSVQVYMGPDATQRANLVGNLQSLKAGGAVSSAELRYDSTASGNPTTHMMGTGAGVPLVLRLTDYIVVPPGKGWSVWVSTTTLTAAFVFKER